MNNSKIIEMHLSDNRSQRQPAAIDPYAAVPPAKDMVWIPGASFRMGSNLFYPEERPVCRVSVDGFWMDCTPVTNAQFAVFVEATGYVTFAEKVPNAADYPGARPELLRAGSLVFIPPPYHVDRRKVTNWWVYVFGADWRHPQGLHSTIEGLDDYPVVHVTYGDAAAYAVWANKQLPTEAEWEFAARGGLQEAVYAWGNEFTPGGRHMANTWQGEFPWQNLASDGFAGTSPVGSFPANGYGLADMIGNVWEWTDDWYLPRHVVETTLSCCIPHNPRGGSEEASRDPALPHVHIPRKVLKGGSHLCAPNYCRRYRPAARHAEAVDTSTSHVGFRCIVRPKPPVTQ
jgi:formylglycine-generating enzyme required for sulfatase activity